MLGVDPFILNVVILVPVIVALPIVSVPLLPPNATAVAALPMFKVVAVALNMVAVVFVVVISPPFTAKSPLAVIFVNEGESAKSNVNVSGVVAAVIVIFASDEEMIKVSAEESACAVPLEPPEPPTLIVENELTPAAAAVTIDDVFMYPNAPVLTSYAKTRPPALASEICGTWLAVMLVRWALLPDTITFFHVGMLISF